jgi:hypothetical protein
MNSNRTRWQSRWDVDPVQHVATHESGLMVRVEDGVGKADNAMEVEHTLVPMHGVHNAPAMVQRLIREGAQLLIDPFARGWRGQTTAMRQK